MGKSKRAERLAQYSTAQPEKAKNLKAKFPNRTPRTSIHRVSPEGPGV